MKLYQFLLWYDWFRPNFIEEWTYSNLRLTHIKNQEALPISLRRKACPWVLQYGYLSEHLIPLFLVVRRRRIALAIISFSLNNYTYLPIIYTNYRLEYECVRISPSVPSKLIWLLVTEGSKSYERFVLEFNSKASIQTSFDGKKTVSLDLIYYRL